MNKFILIIFFSIFIINLTNAYDLPPKCYLPNVVGPCKAALRRWWYNNGQCKQFIYGGCRGNENNFKTLEECQQNCNKCKLPKIVGPCLALIPRWWYDNGECKEFNYGGCKGNANNFETLQECQENCNICYLPKVVGPCDAYFERWWYNNGECKKFIYGGCGSNGNNFETLEECQKNCNATEEYEKK